MKKVITIEQFCSFMSFSPKQALALIRYGALEAVRFGENKLIVEDSVSDLIARIEASDEDDQNHEELAAEKAFWRTQETM